MNESTSISLHHNHDHLSVHHEKPTFAASIITHDYRHIYHVHLVGEKNHLCRTTGDILSSGRASLHLETCGQLGCAWGIWGGLKRTGNQGPKQLLKHPICTRVGRPGRFKYFLPMS